MSTTPLWGATLIARWHGAVLQQSSIDRATFSNVTMMWPLLKKLILRELWNAASMHEGQATLQISKETITEVVETVAGCPGRLNWQRDWQGTKSSRLQLAQNANWINEQIEAYRGWWHGDGQAQPDIGRNVGTGDWSCLLDEIFCTLFH